MRDKIILLHHKLEKYWFFSIVFLKFSSIWFSFILVFAGNGWLTSVNPQTNAIGLTTLGTVLSIIIIFVNLFFVFVGEYGNKHDEIKENAEKTLAEKFLLEKINSEVFDVCKQKFESQIQVIKEKRVSFKDIPHVYTSPCVQIERLSISIEKCLIELMSFSSHKFYNGDLRVDVFYNFPLENASTWKLSKTANTPSISLDRIINGESTFNYLLKSDLSYVFFNSKEDALQKRCYLRETKDRSDEKGKLKGSIACYKLSFGDEEQVYINAVLAITSYNEEFIDEKGYQKKYPKDNNKAKEEIEKATNMLAENIYTNLVINFRHRIGIELCNYYLQFLEDKAKKDD